MELIAEIGSNHQGSIATALKLIEEAGKSGATAVKFQKRTLDELYTRSFLDAPYNSESSFGATYGEHRHHLEFHGKSEYRLLRVAAEDAGCKFYATAFDFSAVDFLASIPVDGIKIASGDVTNTPLLSYAASMGIPLHVSTGACELDDVKRAVDAVMVWQPHFTLYHCTAAYPVDFAELDLGVISLYKELFPELTIGLSDHANAIWPCGVAYVLGARAFEKHFTLSRAMQGTDHAFSLEPQGLQKLARDLERVKVSLGAEKRFHASEVPAQVKMGKSLVAARSIKAGATLHVDDIAIKSPSGTGLPPHRFMDLVGAKAVRNLKEDDPITDQDIQAELLPADQRRSKAVGN